MAKKPKQKQPAKTDDLLPSGEEAAPLQAVEPRKSLGTRKSVRLDDLHLDPDNARRHPEKNMAAITGALRQFGQVEPLVVQKGTGKIIGGNGRYQCMRALGWETCEVVEVDLDDEHATALGITLNRTAELAEWDDDTLERLLGELQDADFALDEVGFDKDDLAKILKDSDGGGQSLLVTDEKLDSGLTYSVIVTMENEQEQTTLLTELEARGLKCKLLIS